MNEFGGVTVGDKLPRTERKITQDTIQAYAEASGDFNPLHIDPEFAKGTFYGRTIAHGLNSLAFVAQIMTEWDWKGWGYGGELEVTFLSPVFPDETLCVTGEVVEIETRDNGIYAKAKLSVLVDERTILVGNTWRYLGNS